MMIRSQFIIAALVLTVAGTVYSQASRPNAESRTFELTPTAPPTPALKYQLHFNFADSHPGNAASVYMQAIMFLGAETDKTAQKALDAYAAKDFKTFEALADSLKLPTMYEELEVAGRRERCDWDPPVRQRGEGTLLPHLEPLAHGVSRAIQTRALRQIQQGKLSDALGTLRLGYELGDNVGTEPILVSSLVSIAITTRMNEALVELMNHADSPNLYWALSEFPARRPILRRSWDHEAWWIFYCIPTLQKVRAGQELSAEQWRTALIDETLPFYSIAENYVTVRYRPHPDPISGANPPTVKNSQQFYAQTHQITPEQAAKIDPAIVLGNFYYHEYEVASDEVAKLRGLPYPMMLTKTREVSLDLDRLRREQPSNPFIELVAPLHNAVLSVARADRQIAALTAVEAVRSYAAANGGKLPDRLDDVTDTPVPVNPLTGKPFDYKVDNDIATATLSDPSSEAPLTYTIRIRK
ncbi:MAG TPA: hypothetical protein VH518_15260 [Tepidisphaeraceae bacterium]|jgi:hypothetical protein